MPREEKFSKLLSFPHDGFLMIRYEFMILTGGNELEAKTLRIIEKEMEVARGNIYKRTMNNSHKEMDPNEIVEVTKDVWVPISYRLFMAEMYGTVASENTLKRALKSLLKKKLISRRYNPTGRYDAPEYQLNSPTIQEELDKLKKLGRSGYQPLIPSTDDTIKKERPQELTPSNGLRVSNDDNPGYQKLTPNYNSSYYRDTKEEESIRVDDSANPNTLESSDSNSSLSFLLAEFEKLQKQNEQLAAQVEQLSLKLNQTGDPNVPDVTPSPSSSGSSTPATTSVRNNPWTSLLDSGPHTFSVKDVQDVEQHIRMYNDELRIAVMTTRNRDSAECKALMGIASIKQTEQGALFEVPDNPPVMPHEGAKWCPETIVQIVEAKLEHRFEEIMRGKTQKTQRERQLIAAKKIIAAKVTREEFDKAYDNRNDDWWCGKYGELTVVDMAGNTKNGVMRTLEVLENIARRKVQPKNNSNVISFQDRQSRQPATTSTKPVVTARSPKSEQNLEEMLRVAAEIEAKALQGVM